MRLNNRAAPPPRLRIITPRDEEDGRPGAARSQSARPTALALELTPIKSSPSSTFPSSITSTSAGRQSSPRTSSTTLPVAVQSPLRSSSPPPTTLLTTTSIVRTTQAAPVTVTASVSVSIESPTKTVFFQQPAVTLQQPQTVTVTAGAVAMESMTTGGLIATMVAPGVGAPSDAVGTGGISGPGAVFVGVLGGIAGVAVLSIVGIILWRRRRKTQNFAEKLRS